MLISQLAFAFSFVLGAVAYTVTSPSSSSPWTSTGPNTLSWIRVESDPTTFAVVLTNTDRSALPVNNQPLAASIDGTTGAVAISPAPGGFFPVGAGFRVNLIKSASEVDTILAQSPMFSIISTDDHSPSSVIPTIIAASLSFAQSPASTAASATQTQPVPGTTLTVTGLSPTANADIPMTSSGALHGRVGIPTALLGLMVVMAVII